MKSKIIRWFETGHLPQHLAIVAQEVGYVARWLDEKLPEGAEKSTALRKLLEAKDAAVRATIEKHETEAAERIAVTKDGE